MKLFTGLRKIREFEKLQLPFLKSVVDFDIVIEIGYAEEEGQPLTLKQLFLLNISSRTTVRRKLARLIEQGIVFRRKHFSFQHQAAGQVWRHAYIYFIIAFHLGGRNSARSGGQTNHQRERTCSLERQLCRWLLPSLINFAEA